MLCQQLRQNNHHKHQLVVLLAHYEDQLNKARKDNIQQEKKFALKESELLERITNAEVAVEKKQEEYATLLGELTSIKEEVKQQQEEKETINRFGEMIKDLLNIFKG